MSSDNFEIPNLDLDQLNTSLHALIAEDKPQCLKKQLIAALKAENVHGNFSVVINSKLLLNADVMLGHFVLRNPEKALLLFGRALVEQQERMCQQTAPGGGGGAADGEDTRGWKVKHNTHARINWLPAAHRRPNISSIRSHDVGSLIQFAGTVIRSGQIKVLEALRVFKCGNPKCDIPIRCVAATNEIGSIIQMPSGPCVHCKKSASYSEMLNDKICWDYQEVRVQESVQKLEMGSIPRSITLILLHDLVDTCKAGDDVVVTGYPFNRWGTLYKDERCQLEVVIMANTMHVGNASSTLQGGAIDHLAFMDEFQRFWMDHAQNPLRGRDVLVRSICPQLHGLYYIKLAVLLCLCGSSPSIDPTTGARTRGDSHLLLVGDPGTGKSQFLRFACKLMTRSVLTTGCGTTSAGLTCATVREGNEFMLEAGALVLADRGVCCIDEFGSIREQDRNTILEAMEQQILSVAKAGLVTQLNTRAIIIAATNPKGQYDVDSDLSANTGIAPPLLSRFDLVLVLLDRPDHSWDRTVSEFVLKSHVDAKSMRMAVTSEGSTPPPPPPSDVNIEASKNMVLSLDKLRAYLSHVRKTFEPTLTTEAGEVLRKYYTSQRRSEHDGSGRTTLRFLESLIRISKAHARLMARDVVLVADALITIALVDISVQTVDGGGGAGDLGLATLHIDFPDNPDVFYHDQIAKDVLGKLGISMDTYNIGFGDDCGSGGGHASGGSSDLDWDNTMYAGQFTHAFFPSNEL